MRSLVMGVFYFQSALSAALGEAFVSLSADPLLIWNYGVMGVLSAGAGIVFWFCESLLHLPQTAAAFLTVFRRLQLSGISTRSTSTSTSSKVTSTSPTRPPSVSSRMCRRSARFEGI